MTVFTEGPTVTVNKAALDRMLHDYESLCFGIRPEGPLSPAFHALKEQAGETA